MEALLSSSFVNILIRLFLAILLGGLIGLERGFHGRPAGLRTHILVCLGATILMVTPQIAAANFGQSMISSWAQIDPGRIVAGIVTGIGFLGAGAIIRIGDIIRGLTTAACIWFTAALGVVIGSGHYGLAIISTVLVLIVLLLFDKLGHLIVTAAYRSIAVTVNQENSGILEKRSTDIFKHHGIRIQDQSHRWFREKGEVQITFQIRAKNHMGSGPVVTALSQVEGVTSVIWE